MSWITLSYSRPGQCKSIDASRTVLYLLNSYKRISKKYPDLPKRELWINMPLSKDLVNEFPDRIKFWESPLQLIDLRNCDIMYDEIGKDFPADSFKDTPKSIRKLFSHHRKRGLRIYANTQDYKAVDVNIRRMVSRAFILKKLCGSRDISVTLPPLKFIWGIGMKRQFDCDDIEKNGSNPLELKSLGMPTFFFITKKLISVYDTTAEVPEYMPNCLLHNVLTCKDCGLEKVEHSKY